MRTVPSTLLLGWLLMFARYPAHATGIAAAGLYAFSPIHEQAPSLKECGDNLLQFGDRGRTIRPALMEGYGAKLAKDSEAEVISHTLLLRPHMPELPSLGVPALRERVPDAEVEAEHLLGMEPEHPYHWVFAPEEHVDLHLSGRESNRATEATLTVWDWECRPVAREKFAMPFATRVRFQVSGRGTYLLTLDGMRGTDPVFRLVRSFAVCPKNNERSNAWRNNGFWVGQCSFPGWHNARMSNGRFVHPEGLTTDESRELDAELVARMGVQVARINLPVFRRDEQGFDLDFSESDKCVNAFVSRGLKLALQFFAPYGAGRGPVLRKYAEIPLDQAFLCPLEEAPYRHYVREVARRYGKHALFFQVGNEPSNPFQYKGSPEEYVASLSQAVHEIRLLFPRTPITNGGYCNTYQSASRIAEGARGLTDFVSYHCHDTFEGLRTFWTQIRGMHQAAGYTEATYANTEMGYAMPTVGAERANAVAEMRKLLYCWAHGHKGALLYSSRELWWPRQFSYDGISDYGFVDHFFCPRFVYGAVSAFLDRYAGCRFDRVLVESDNLNAYAFSSKGRRLVAAFAAKEPVSLSLISDAQRAAINDPMGNESPAENAKQVTFTAGEYPVTLAFHGATRVGLPAERL